MNTNLRGVYYCIRSFAPMMIARAQRPHRQYLFSGGKKCPAQRRGLCCIQMGIEWIELLGGGRTARLQHPRFGGLSWIGADRAEPARRQRPEKDAAAGRRGSRGGDAGDAAAAIIRQRGTAAPDVETVARNQAVQQICLVRGSVREGTAKGPGRARLQPCHKKPEDRRLQAAQERFEHSANRILRRQSVHRA